MGKKIKEEIHNKHINVKGGIMTKHSMFPLMNQDLLCIVTNDRIGKTLSIGNEEMMFTIPFEAVEQYLK